MTREFREILDSFFPRYLDALHAAKYRDEIEEIRIEGHTSSEWDPIDDSDLAYFRNMALSQDRTRNVLEYCLGRIDGASTREWVRGKITANGFSSSKLILANGVENRQSSRRVEFRVRTGAEARIVEMLHLAEANAAATQ